MSQTVLALIIELVKGEQEGVLGNAHCHHMYQQRKFKLLCACICVLYFDKGTFKCLGNAGNIELSLGHTVVGHESFELFNVSVTLNSLKVSDVQLNLSDETLLGLGVDIHLVNVLDKFEALMLGSCAKVSALLGKNIAVCLSYLGVYLADVALEHIIGAVCLILVDLFKENDKLCTGHTVDIFGKLCEILDVTVIDLIVKALDVRECIFGSKVALEDLILYLVELLYIFILDIFGQLVKLSLFKLLSPLPALSGRCLIELGIKRRLAVFKVFLKLFKSFTVKLVDGSHLLIKLSLVNSFETALNLLNIRLASLGIFGSFADGELHLHKLILGRTCNVAAKVCKLLLDKLGSSLVDLLDIFCGKLLVKIVACKGFSELGKFLSWSIGDILAETFKLGLDEGYLLLSYLFQIRSSILLAQSQCADIGSELFKLGLFELFDILAHTVKLVGLDLVEALVDLVKILLGIFGIILFVFELFGELCKLRLLHIADVLAETVCFGIVKNLSSCLYGIKVACGHIGSILFVLQLCFKSIELCKVHGSDILAHLSKLFLFECLFSFGSHGHILLDDILGILFAFQLNDDLCQSLCVHLRNGLALLNKLCIFKLNGSLLNVSSVLVGKRSLESAGLDDFSHLVKLSLVGSCNALKFLVGSLLFKNFKALGYLLSERCFKRIAALYFIKLLGDILQSLLGSGLDILAYLAYLSSRKAVPCGSNLCSEVPLEHLVKPVGSQILFQLVGSGSIGNGLEHIGKLTELCAEHTVIDLGKVRSCHNFVKAALLDLLLESSQLVVIFERNACAEKLQLIFLAVVESKLDLEQVLACGLLVKLHVVDICTELFQLGFIKSGKVCAKVSQLLFILDSLFHFFLSGKNGAVVCA